MSLVLESQFGDFKCSTPPLVMYRFIVSDLRAQSSNETWAPFYEFVAREYPVGSCGNFDRRTTLGCCYSSLDASPSGSNGFRSGTPQIVDTMSQAIPLTAKNQKYCHLFQNDTTTVMGFKDIYYLANNMCLDGTACRQDGTFAIYNNANCTGPSETLKINGTQRVNKWKAFVRFETIQDASLEFSWIAYTPSTRLVPSFSQNSYELVSCLIAILAAILALFRFSGTFISMLAYGKRKAWHFFTAVIQFLWFVYAFMHMIGYVTIFRDIVSLGVFFQFLKLAFNAATLGSTLVTANLIIVPVLLGQSLLWSFFVNVGLLSIHVALAGYNYLGYWIGDQTANPNLSNFLMPWTNLNSYWILFMMVWNTIPPIVIATRGLSFSPKTWTLWQKIKTLDKMDRWLFPCVLLQVILLAIYFVIKWLQQQEFLREDRVTLALTPVLTLDLVLHSIINARIGDTMSIVWQKIVEQALELVEDTKKI